MKKNKGGRPKEIDGETIRVTYNLTIDQADFVLKQAKMRGIKKSEAMRGLIDYVIAQFEQRKSS